MKIFRFRYTLAMLFAAVFATAARTALAADPLTTWRAASVVEESYVNRTGMAAWFRSEAIDDATFARMRAKSWKAECPLDRAELRYLKMLHRNAEGLPQCGEMVVNAAIADKVLAVFRRLYEIGYRIERMVLIDDYDADDEAAMRANNSSAFNFRFMTGSMRKISKHGLGLAIDINPLYNPYVKRRGDGTWHVEPLAGERYAFDRDSRTDIPYRIDRNDPAYRLFTEAGFEWGGDWTSVKDYQHFEIDLQ